MLADGPGLGSRSTAFKVAMEVLECPRKATQLIECLWDKDTRVYNRAADALEIVSGELPRVLIPWKAALLGLLIEAKHIQLRWHLAMCVARLPLNLPECRRVADVLNSWLDDQSSIVKTCAMQGLAELTRQDPSLLPEVIELFRILTRSGTPAMRARGRMLLEQLQAGKDPRWRRQIPKPVDSRG